MSFIEEEILPAKKNNIFAKYSKRILWIILSMILCIVFTILATWIYGILLSYISIQDIINGKTSFLFPVEKNDIHITSYKTIIMSGTFVGLTGGYILGFIYSCIYAMGEISFLSGGKSSRLIIAVSIFIFIFLSTSTAKGVSLVEWNMLIINTIFFILLLLFPYIGYSLPILFNNKCRR